MRGNLEGLVWPKLDRGTWLSRGSPSPIAPTSPISYQYLHLVARAGAGAGSVHCRQCALQKVHKTAHKTVQVVILAQCATLKDKVVLMRAVERARVSGRC